VSTRLRRVNPISELAQAAAAPLLIGGLTVVTLDMARRLFRHSKLLCPSTEPLVTWNPEDYGIPRERVDEVWFETTDGEMLHGWYCRAEHPVASALYCHGNTGNLTNTAHAAPHLMAGGISILAFDYRGFGRSTGHPSLSGIVADGLCAARFHDEIRPKDVPSLLYGYSLGGAVAAQVALHHSFDGLVLQSTFTSLPDLARVAFPRVPLHLFTGDFFNTLSAVRRLKVPLLVVHGSGDEVCPPWMGSTLCEAAPNPVKNIKIVEGGLHKDLFTRDPDSVVWAINRFAATLPHAEVFDDPSPLLDRWIDGLFRYLRRSVRRALVHHPV
jgi:uncharacterized protein